MFDSNKTHSSKALKYHFACFRFTGDKVHVHSEPRFDFNGTFDDYWEAQWTYDTDKYDFTDPTEEEYEVVLNYYKSNNLNESLKRNWI